MTDTISNSDDMIDSREVIARIAELQVMADAHVEHGTEQNPDDAEELAALKALADEADGAEDWEHGAQLIRDSYFEKYARELAEDLGSTQRDAILSSEMECVA